MAKLCIKGGGQESLFLFACICRVYRKLMWKLFGVGGKLGSLEGRGGRETFTI